MSLSSVINPAGAKIAFWTLIGVIGAGLVLGWGYNNNTPVLSDAAKGFK